MVPIFSHPTKIILIDDHMPFLKSLSLLLPETNLSYEFFDNPIEALNYINQFQEPGSLEFLKNREDVSNDMCLVEYDFPSIYKIIEDNTRNERISTIIVDYHMPEMNGLEFLKQIKNKKIRKILLTGNSSESIAVKAFNEEIIHKYIKKGDSELETILSESIIDSQKKYFALFTQSIIETAINNQEIISALKEPEFEVYVNQICKDYKIKESYLLDPIGSYLMINKHDVAFILTTQNKDLADSYYCDLDGHEEGFSKKELEDIKNKKTIFCYRSLKNEELPDPELWAPYFKPGTHIKGKQSFYCSLNKLDKSLLSPDMLKEFSSCIQF